jgi:hypothetical protein
MSYYGADENRQIPPQPPYNATNFTTANEVIYNTMVNNAKTQPNYPLNTGSDSDQINRQIQNVSYFTSMQQQTQNGTKPFPAFKLDQRRLMYIQGQYATASRNIITKENTSGPAGVPFYTAPSAPTLISAIQGLNQIVVTFTGPEFVFTSPNQACESKINSYQIQLNNSLQFNNIRSSPYTITGINSTTPYQCTIAAVNAGGVGQFSNALTTYVIPSPTEFQAIPTGASGIVTIYFDEAITEFNTGNYTIYQYRIEALNTVDPTLTKYYEYTPANNTATSYIYTATDLTNGVPYTFSIVAVINPSNPQISQPSVYAPLVIPYSAPLAPTNITAIIPDTGGTEVEITFQQSMNGENTDSNQITEYMIRITHTGTTTFSDYLYTPVITDSGSVTLTYSILMGAGLSINVSTPITVIISATNSAGTTFSAPYSTTVRPFIPRGRSDPPSVPSAPLLGASAGINTVYLTFVQSSTGGLSNTYQYSINGGSWITFVPIYTGSSYYFKLKNMQGGRYIFAARAVNTRGPSIVSNNVIVNIPTIAEILSLLQRFSLLMRR